MTAGAEQVEVLTAFTVVVTPDGKALALPDFIPDGISTAHRAELSHIKAACDAISDDIRTEELAARISAKLKPAPTTFDPAKIHQRLQERLGESGD